jgi:hypothetical protein
MRDTELYSILHPNTKPKFNFTGVHYWKLKTQNSSVYSGMPMGHEDYFTCTTYRFSHHQRLYVIFFYVSPVSAHAKRTHAPFYNVGDAKSTPELNNKEFVYYTYSRTQLYFTQ